MVPNGTDFATSDLADVNLPAEVIIREESDAALIRGNDSVDAW